MSETGIEVGQRWRSRDKRDNGRTVEVVEVDQRIGIPVAELFVTTSRGGRRSRMRVRTLRTRYELVGGHVRRHGPNCLGCDYAVAAERQRVLAEVETLADLFVEQGDEHVAGCMGQADCAACCAADLRALVARLRGQG